MSQRYRNGRDFLAGYAGKMARRLASMISRRLLDLAGSDGDRVTALGRESLDGDIADDVMDAFSPVGIIGRPAAAARVEAAVAFIGADGTHPVDLAFLDSTRRDVIAAVKLEADETIVYSSQSMVKITKDGEVLIGRIGGEFKAVALADHSHTIPDLAPGSQASYAPGTTGPATSGPDSVSDDAKVT